MEEMNGSVERSEKLLKKVVDRAQSEEEWGVYVDMEDGVPTFTYAYDGEPGIVCVELLPEEKLIPWASEESRRIVERIFLAYNSQVEKEGSGGRKLEGALDEYGKEEEDDALVVLLALTFVHTMGRFASGESLALRPPVETHEVFNQRRRAGSSLRQKEVAGDAMLPRLRDGGADSPGR